MPARQQPAYMNRKILYLVNPISGTTKKKKLEPLIRQHTEAAGIDYDIIPSVADGNYKHLLPLIEEGVTDIVACGGDGTINALVASLQNAPVNIGIVPLGSGNGLALTAGIATQPAKALQVIFGGKTMPVDGFTINGRFSCMLSGIGFDAQVAYNFSQNGRRGLLTYTQESLAQFFKAGFYPFDITLPETQFATEAFFISIANSSQFGNNVTIAPKASLNDGLLDIVIVQKMSKLQLPFAVLQQIRGGNQLQPLDGVDNSDKNILYFQTPRLQINNSGMAPLHIDGDPAETASQFDIQIIPNAFRLLVP